MAYEDAVDLFRSMIDIRNFEEEVFRLLSTGEAQGVTHPYCGEEAIAVGICSALGPTDFVGSYYRGHGHAIARGVPMASMFAEILSRESALCEGKGGSMHMTHTPTRFVGGNSIVGANVGILAGFALGIQTHGTDDIAVVFFGDGACGEGVVRETLEITAVNRLPLVLVCENNRWQELNPTSDVMTSQNQASRLAQAHDIPVERVDGNTVFAVRAAARRAVERARSGGGPTMIDAETFLLYGHSRFGSKPPDEYRSPEEISHWQSRDPIGSLMEILRQAGTSSDDLEIEVARSRERVSEALSAAKSQPPLTSVGVGENVWSIR